MAVTPPPPEVTSEYVPPPPPVPAPNTGSSVYYRNCQAAKDAGAAPLYRGQPGYRSGLATTVTAWPASGKATQARGQRL